ncbi:MAG: 4,5-dihydroxyphthalate decarboxylase [Rhodospirillaceae bacterium]|nr:4,5-dihydroxyphthalate decarboxylase [Rhodospirillaceae bacterium]
MSKNIPITLACGDYAITQPLMDGSVKADGIDLTVVTDMDSTTRHWRFFNNEEFDIAEASCSTYLVAKDQGLPFDAIPVYLHRRFRHGFVFVNTSAGIKDPKDLIGKKVGIKHWQVTAILWMRGILEHEYGVPHRSIKWYQELDQDIPVRLPGDIKLQTLSNNQSVETMLVEGELDACIHSSIIKPFLRGDSRVARLWPNFKEEEVTFFKKTGMFPIMHILGIKRNITDQYPWVPINIYRALNKAKDIALKKLINPRIVPLAWYREFWEEQQKLLGDDPWEYGLSNQNRKTLQNMIQYSKEQALIKRNLSVDELFLNMDQGRKRGV